VGCHHVAPLDLQVFGYVVPADGNVDGSVELKKLYLPAFPCREPEDLPERDDKLGAISDEVDDEIRNVILHLRELNLSRSAEQLHQRSGSQFKESFNHQDISAQLHTNILQLHNSLDGNHFLY
jgi:hypothetical protein